MGLLAVLKFALLVEYVKLPVEHWQAFETFAFVDPSASASCFFHEYEIIRFHL